MRRKTDRDVLKENDWLIIGSVLLILCGIFFAVLPHILPRADYDSLQTKEVTVTAFGQHRGYRTARYDFIRTADGEKYNISGDYKRDELKKILTEGRKVTIKWYRNEPFWTLLAEEIYVDGERVVAYDNDDVDWEFALIFGCCFIVPGIAGFFLLWLCVKKNRKIQKERYERLMRKRDKTSQ